MMTKLNTFTPEELVVMKEKMTQARVGFSEKIVLKLFEELEAWDLLKKLETELTVENIGFEKADYGEVIKLGEAEYLILTDEEADDLLRERLEEIIEWNGFSAINDLNPIYYMDKEVLEKMMIEHLEEWIDELSEEELEEEMGLYDVESKEELIEEKVRRTIVIDYWLDFMDEDDLVKTLIDRDGFDMDEMIEDFINWYGRGHELATYDGYEIELSVDDETFYAYRIN